MRRSYEESDKRSRTRHARRNDGNHQRYSSTSNHSQQGSTGNPSPSHHFRTNSNNQSPRTRHARQKKRKSSDTLSFDDDTAQSRIKCVRFLVNHSEAMIDDDPDLYKKTISTLLNPLIKNSKKDTSESCPRNKKLTEEKEDRDDRKIRSGSGVTCNGGGNDNHAEKRGVARAVKPGSGLSPLVSAGHTHACNGGLHPATVIDLVSDCESDSSDDGRFLAVDTNLFSKEEFNRLIQSCVQDAGRLKFTQQSLVCLMQTSAKINNSGRKTSDPSLVEFVLGIQRNGYGQIYLVQGLQRALHFTIPTSDFKKIVERPYPPMDSDSGQPGARKVDHIMIPNSQNYVSSDKKTIVYNASISTNSSSIPPEQKAIRACTNLVIGMFKDGLSEAFSYLERKRSGFSKNSYSNADELVDGSCAISMASIVESTNHSQSSSKSNQSTSSKRRSRKKKKNDQSSFHRHAQAQPFTFSAISF